MKVIIIITILFSSLLFPISTFAQTGTCRTGADGFVDWKKCLEGTPPVIPPSPTSTLYSTSGLITTPVFINNAYQEFYDESLKPGTFCFSSTKFVWKLQQIYDPKECATSRVLNKMALDVFSILLGVMFLIFCFLIFRSRIMYITSGDNEEQTKKSKKMATAAFIGFLMVFLGLIIGQILALSIGSNLWEFKLFG